MRLQTALCNVELQGSLTRGQSVLDFEAPEQQHNVRVVTDMDMQGVLRMLNTSVAPESELYFPDLS